MGFEWDDEKARINRSKHGVSFDEASSVFGDAPEFLDDVLHSDTEYRYRVIGWSDRGRLIAVTATDRGGDVRIISARRATAAEAKAYGEA